MARSISDIYNALCISKASMQELSDWVVDNGNPGSTLDNAETLLQDLTSASKVAIWRLWLWIFAVGSWIVESLFDTHQGEITTIIATQKPHNLYWYEQQAKLFQYGYAMIWDKGAFSYSMIDPTAQVVKYSKATELNGSVLIKVATIINSVMGPLPFAQLTALTLFFTKWKDAGVPVTIINLAPDIVQFTMTIIRDRLVLAANNSLLSDSGSFPITDAINTFGDNLEFGGILRLSSLQDAIKAAPGVIDVKIYSAQIKPAGGNFSAIDLFCVPASGYVTIDWVNSAITYIDNVNVQVQS
jgi:hypothetical protein